MATAEDIRKAIRAEKPVESIVVYQTGGGVATIYVGEFRNGRAAVAIGPGRYNWREPWQSELPLDGDTAVGPDDDGTAVPVYPTDMPGLVAAVFAVLEPDTSGLDDHQSY